MNITRIHVYDALVVIGQIINRNTHVINSTYRKSPRSHNAGLER